MDYITAPGNCERRRSAPAPIRDSVPHRCSGSYCPYISRLPAWLRRYIWLIQVLARLCFGFSKATIAAIVPIVLITSWAIQRSKGIPEHSLTSTSYISFFLFYADNSQASFIPAALQCGVTILTTSSL